MKVKQLERELDRHKHGNQQMMARKRKTKPMEVKGLPGTDKQGG